jgi:hypothetical protein
MLQDIGMDKELLNNTSKEGNKMKKTNETTSNLKVLKGKDKINRVKTEPTGSKKTFANYTLDKALILGIHS